MSFGMFLQYNFTREENSRTIVATKETNASNEGREENSRAIALSKINASNEGREEKEGEESLRGQKPEAPEADKRMKFMK